MEIEFGYELVFEFPQPTPLVLMLEVHSSRIPDLLIQDQIVTDPFTPISVYQDNYGNSCSRLVAPKGEFRLSTRARIKDSGEPDIVVPFAHQQDIESLPFESLIYLLPSRYCDTELMLDAAWQKFENAPLGWARVQTICDFVHQHLNYDFETASPTKTASQALDEGAGVCRDYAHLAISLCRCMNIPARYCCGYMLHEDGPDVPHEPEFAAWFEALLDGQWYTFDARFNEPRKGRILISRGRDAADVPIMHAFGFSTISSFDVWAKEA
jgi:transglutaminase-like putative cysteine protease